jgi:hypothetical protein
MRQHLHAVINQLRKNNSDGGSLKKAAIALVVLVLSFSWSVSGCQRSPEHDLDTVMPQWAIDLMTKVPGDSKNANYVDVKTLREEPALRDEYAQFVVLIDPGNPITGFDIDPSSYFAILPMIGVGIDQLDYWLLYDYGYLMLGDFDLLEIRGNLINGGWVNDEYAGFEIWENQEHGFELVVFDGGLALLYIDTARKKTVQTIQGEYPSIYTNDRFIALMSRLPANGFQIGYQECEVDIESFCGTISMGATWVKRNNHSIEVTYVLTSLNGDNIDNLVKKMVTDLEKDETLHWSDITVIRDGKFVKLTARYPISTSSSDE